MKLEDRQRKEGVHGFLDEITREEKFEKRGRKRGKDRLKRKTKEKE